MQGGVQRANREMETGPGCCLKISWPWSLRSLSLHGVRLQQHQDVKTLAALVVTSTQPNGVITCTAGPG
jgi:hypothetical protein